MTDETETYLDAELLGCADAPAVDEILPDPQVMAAATHSNVYGTPAMYGIYDHVTVKGMRRSGIVGNAAHTYGYHRARNELGASDYSVQAPADHRGDGWAASAIDLSFGPAEMRVVTRRLIDSMRDKTDRRSDCIREVFGTLDGHHVTGWNAYADANRGVGPTSSDSSHLWHVHLSIFREFSGNVALMRGVADIINGTPKKEDDMPITDADLDKIRAIVKAEAHAAVADLLAHESIVRTPTGDHKPVVWALGTLLANSAPHAASPTPDKAPPPDKAPTSTADKSAK